MPQMWNRLARQIIRTDRAPQPTHPISQAVKVGNLVYTAGQVGTHPKTGELPEDVGQQIRNTFKNIEAILKAAGTGMDNVVKATVYLRDLADRERYLNAIWKERFPRDPPARTTIQAGLGRLAVEIEVVATVP